MKLKPQFVGCGFGIRRDDRDHWPQHPLVEADNGDGPTPGGCQICALLDERDSTRNVLQEILDCMLEGKVVLAADGLRGWLARYPAPTKGQEP